jgi:predicted nucleotidyltransferase
MKRAADTDLNSQLPLEQLGEVFEQMPVRVVLCFGSHATGSVHHQSDVDLAVELDGVHPGDEEYNDVFFDVYAAVADTLDRDDVDLVDLQSVSGTLARTIFDTGVVIYGDPQQVEALRDEYDITRDDRSPQERLDRAIERMDEHLA